MKTATQMVKRYEEAGFRLVRSKRHLIWRCPCGKHQLTQPKSPGASSPNNGVGDIARTIRICKQNMSEGKAA